MYDSASMDVIAGRLQVMVIFEWAAIILFLVFLGTLAYLVLGFVKSVKDLRSRRIQPIVNGGKALAKTGADTAKSLTVRGKRIAEIGMHTLQELEMRAQTTTKIVKGTIPEAKKMSGEMNAAADDMRDVVTQIERVTKAAKTAQGIQAALKIAASVKSVAKTVGDVRRSSREA
ncbi:MAG: hypothetical protein M3Y56_06865 [Armatimonadota bacterium]|nr:hypothetical protein [Armatimonadota bacterium]